MDLCILYYLYLLFHFLGCLLLLLLVPNYHIGSLLFLLGYYLIFLLYHFVYFLYSSNLVRYNLFLLYFHSRHTCNILYYFLLFHILHCFLLNSILFLVHLSFCLFLFHFHCICILLHCFLFVSFLTLFHFAMYMFVHHRLVDFL